VIGLHDSDGGTFPNLALMKLSAWHKAKGDRVRWFAPIERFDTIYSSKVFTFTDWDSYLPDGVRRGGTGYRSPAVLADEIEHQRPDYDLYGIDYGMGFLTRGCPRRCSWCVVPDKEGGIDAHADHEEFIKAGSRDLVLMDNNVLAHDHGLREIDRMAKAGYRVDFNQGLDARIIAGDEGVARLLARCRWLRPPRLSCDHMGMIGIVDRAVELLRKHGRFGSRHITCYILVKDVDDALARAEFLRRIDVQPFAQPYRDQVGTPPTLDQRHFARWCNRPQLFNAMSWEDYAHRQATIVLPGQLGMFE